MRVWLTIINLISVVTLSGCSLLGRVKSSVTPTLNPSPKHFFTLKGLIDPSLKGKVYLAFVQTYAGMSTACTQTVNSFEGIEGQPTQELVYVPRPNAKGQYILNIPLDRYLPGRCHWRSYSLGLRFSKKADADAEGFIDYGKRMKHIPAVYNFVCQESADSCRIDIPKGTWAYFTVSGVDSSTQVFNLLAKKVS